MVTVERLGKARELPAEELNKYKKAYDEIISYLNENYKGYLVYCVSGGTNKLIEPALMSCIEKGEKAGLFGRLRESLQAGDAVEFGFQCECLEVLYKYYENEYRVAKKALKDMMRVS